MSNPDQAGNVAQAMITLWKEEFPATVRVLSSVRDETRDYTPDGKSRTAWQIAVHMATADSWFIESVVNGGFQFDPEASSRAEAQFKSVSDIVSFYEEKIPAGFDRLGGLSGDQLAEELDFFGMMKKTRAMWIGFASNHSIHHRGQLSGYLRALGSKVPDIYGPSGDSEQG